MVVKSIRSLLETEVSNLSVRCVSPEPVPSESLSIIVPPLLSIVIESVGEPDDVRVPNTILLPPIEPTPLTCIYAALPTALTSSLSIAISAINSLSEIAVSVEDNVSEGVPATTPKVPPTSRAYTEPGSVVSLSP